MAISNELFSRSPPSCIPLFFSRGSPKMSAQEVLSLIRAPEVLVFRLNQISLT